MVDRERAMGVVALPRRPPQRRSIGARCRHDDIDRVHFERLSDKGRIRVDEDPPRGTTFPASSRLSPSAPGARRRAIDAGIVWRAPPLRPLNDVGGKRARSRPETIAASGNEVASRRSVYLTISRIGTCNRVETRTALSLTSRCRCPRRPWRRRRIENHHLGRHAPVLVADDGMTAGLGPNVERYGEVVWPLGP